MENKTQPDFKEQLRPIDILLVEDSEIDIMIIKRIFEKVKLANMLYIAHNGEEALDFIYRRGKYAKEKLPIPGLILLDIRMPGIDGFEVLKKLKANPMYKRIPVIMLTTPNMEEDIAKSYEEGACSFITKPIDINSFVEVMRQFELYWILVSKVPSTEVK